MICFFQGAVGGPPLSPVVAMLWEGQKRETRKRGRKMRRARRTGLGEGRAVKLCSCRKWN